MQDVTITNLEGYRNDYVFTLVFCTGWLLWIPLTFLVTRISKAYPIEKKDLNKKILTHIGFAVLVTGLHLCAEAALVILFIKVFFPAKDIGKYVPMLMLFSLQAHFIIYFMIVAIHQGFNYINAFQKASIKAVALEAKLAEAQNQALKMQIRPHFLFNTHHSIISLLHAGKREEAIEMLVGLSDLLRKTLDHHHTNLVSVKDELNLVKLYLSIQEVRFKDRLKIHYDIDVNSLQKEIPPFTLQPIVENALVHGIEPVSDSGNLLIRIALNENFLHINIEDDGAGLNKTNLKEGVGLSNVKNRLENIYGDRFKFSICNKEIKGTAVEIDLPLVNDTPAQKEFVMYYEH